MPVRSFLIESSSKLLVTRTGIKAWTSYFGPDQTTHFGVTCPWMTKILHFRTWISLKPVGQSWSNLMCSITGGGERLHNVWGRLDQNSDVHGNRKPPLNYNGENGVSTFSRLLLIRSFFILAGNEDMHIISNEFEFQPDRTTDYGVSCPWASKKFPIDLLWENGVSMLAYSFFIESSSKLLVTRTGIKAQLSLILGWIRPLILELLALEWRKFHTFELEYLWSQLVSLDQILCVASLGWGKGCIRFRGRLTWHIELRWAIVALWATCLKSPQRRIQDLIKMTEFVLLSTASKTAWKNSNWFKSYDHFSQYAN